MRTGVLLSFGLLLVACADDPDGGAAERPALRDASLDVRVPMATLSDWTSYADAVVIATVTDEIPPNPTDELGKLGWPQDQTIRVDEVVWQHAAASAPPAVVDGAGGAYLVIEVKDEWLLRAASVGQQFFIPLTKYDGAGWTPIAPAIDVVDGLADPAVGDTYPYATALAGLDASAIRAALDAAPPDPVAEANRTVDASARFEAVIDATN
ncbi:MAG: hypothetical protein ACR2HP_03180 [Ilumatobacteraceae bacterium]